MNEQQHPLGQLAPPSQVFIVRCWRTAPTRHGQWRFRVEVPGSAWARVLTSWEELHTFLVLFLRVQEASWWARPFSSAGGSPWPESGDDGSSWS